MELNVHSKNNCFQVSPEEMKAIEDKAVSFSLSPGTNTISIQSGNFSHQFGQSGEPLVMLWIYGGDVTNHQTKVPVQSTWSSLNGYSDRSYSMSIKARSSPPFSSTTPKAKITVKFRSPSKPFKPL
ncbi:MAG: hypothetical protein HC860_25235 [Alkalinema sp. RU_4_3]|nr:hypothetical protein [Alkalinema sp. RU_4_3]